MTSHVGRRPFLKQVGQGVIGGALAAVVGCRPNAETTGTLGEWSPDIAALDERIPGVMRQHGVPGLSIAIVRDAAILWQRGYGVQDVETNVPVDDRTIFEAASMSKPVFAYVVMKLCERGVIGLDVPLSSYVSDRFLERDPRLDLITARHVLSHTSGFQNTRTGAKPLQIQFQPGSRWEYSGEGYAYLQSVVTALTGRVDRGECARYEADLLVCGSDFGEYMQTHLLDPFGMSSSGYIWRDAFAGHMARPHDGTGAALSSRAYQSRSAVARYGAMGGLLTTAGDYARFLIEMLHPRQADAFRINETSRHEMVRPQIAVEKGPGYSISWGLGWRLAQTAAGDLVSHGGDQTGFHSIAEISVPRRTGFVVLTNGDNGWKLVQELAPAMSRWVNGAA